MKNLTLSAIYFSATLIFCSSLSPAIEFETDLSLSEALALLEFNHLPSTEREINEAFVKKVRQFYEAQALSTADPDHIKNLASLGDARVILITEVRQQPSILPASQYESLLNQYIFSTEEPQQGNLILPEVYPELFPHPFYLHQLKDEQFIKQLLMQPFFTIDTLVHNPEELIARSGLRDSLQNELKIQALMNDQIIAYQRLLPSLLKKQLRTLYYGTGPDSHTYLVYTIEWINILISIVNFEGHAPEKRIKAIELFAELGLHSDPVYSTLIRQLMTPQIRMDVYSTLTYLITVYGVSESIQHELLQWAENNGLDLAIAYGLLRSSREDLSIKTYQAMRKFMISLQDPRTSLSLATRFIEQKRYKADAVRVLKKVKNHPERDAAAAFKAFLELSKIGELRSTNRQINDLNNIIQYADKDLVITFLHWLEGSPELRFPLLLPLIQQAQNLGMGNELLHLQPYQLALSQTTGQPSQGCADVLQFPQTPPESPKE